MKFSQIVNKNGKVMDNQKYVLPMISGRVTSVKMPQIKFAIPKVIAVFSVPK